MSLHLGLGAARCNRRRQPARSRSDSSRDKAPAPIPSFDIHPSGARSLLFSNVLPPSSPIVILIVFVKRERPPSAAGSADLKANDHLLLDEELVPGVI